jgi:CHAT domain-containing protein/tetratricopeptide (TPR) repeat protein
MTNRLLFSPLLCCILCAAHAQVPPSGQQHAIEEGLLAACRNNTTLLDSLVKTNRLAVKPLVEDMLARAMKSDPDGSGDAFREGLQTARVLSASFRRVHGERSLLLAVDSVQSWSGGQRRTKLIADSLNALATKLRAKAGTRDSALALYRNALAFYRSIGDRRGEGTVLGGIGFVYWYRNDSIEVLRYFKEGLSVRTIVDDRQLMGNSFNDIGSAYYRFYRDYPRAIEYLARAAELRSEIGDWGGLGRTLDNMALAYWDSGDLDRALENYDAAARAHERAADQERVARSLYNRGILLTELGQYAQALLAFDRSLDLRQRLGDTTGIAQIFDARGVVYYRMGDFESAYGSYRQALSMMDRAGDDRGVAAASYKVGVVLSDLGRGEQAFSAYQKALEMARRAGDSLTALNALSNMAATYIDKKQYSDAERVLGTSLAMSRELNEQTVEIIDQIMMGNALNFQRKSASARQNYRDALSKAEARHNLELMWPALLGLGDLEEKHQGYEQAIGFYRRALECIERIRGNLASEQFKITFADRKRYVYEAVIHLLTMLHGRNPSAGYDRQAFRLAEGAKARAFLDLLGESLADVRAGADSVLRASEDSLNIALTNARQRLEAVLQDSRSGKERAATLRSQIENLERSLRSLENDLRERNPRYAALRYPEPVGIDEVREKLLDSQTVMLEYSLGDSSSSLWVVTRERCALFRLPSRESLRGQIETFCTALSDWHPISLEMLRSSGRHLYETVIGPAAPYLRDGARLLIVPDGELHNVPFEALLTDGGGRSYQDLPYLLRRHPVAYVQSASVMCTLRDQRHSPAQREQKDLIAFGDPVFPGTGGSDTAAGEVPRLPYTGVEVNDIAKLFPPGRADVFVREDASEERVKLKGLLAGYRFVHFATHGVVNEQRPDVSAVLLSASPSSREDGYLRSSEIFNLQIPADLVVLSACRTGMGKMSPGEGLIGLTRAFMYAGTPSVVVSLWSVADVSTSVLMQKFYECMTARGLDKAEALRQAKLSLCQGSTYAHPFYWAPFIIVGDWKYAP